MFTNASSEKRETRPRSRSWIRGFVTPQRLAASVCVQPPLYHRCDLPHQFSSYPQVRRLFGCVRNRIPYTRLTLGFSHFSPLGTWASALLGRVWPRRSPAKRRRRPSRGSSQFPCRQWASVEVVRLLAASHFVQLIARLGAAHPRGNLAGTEASCRGNTRAAQLDYVQPDKVDNA